MVHRNPQLPAILVLVRRYAEEYYESSSHPRPETLYRLHLECSRTRPLDLSPFLTMDATSALAIYRAEKDKALRERRVSHVQLMAEAQDAFRKMLADAQLARKGGRPKGSTNANVAASSAAVAAAPVVTKAVPKSAKEITPATSVAPKVEVSAQTAPKSSAAKPAAKALSAKGRSVKAGPVKVAASKGSTPKRKPVGRASHAQPAAKRATAKHARPAKASASARKGAAAKPQPRRKLAAAKEHARKPAGRKR